MGRVPDWVAATAGVEAIERLDARGPNVSQANRYEPSPQGAVTGLLRRMDLDWSRYTFVDLGSGKGRALWEAAAWPFREVVGVEFAAELHAAAEALLRSARPGTFQARSVRSVHGDATTWEPPAGPWVIYLFNPFSASVLARALDRVLRDAQPEDDAWLLYLYPDHASVVIRDWRWELRGGEENSLVWELPAGRA